MPLLKILYVHSYTAAGTYNVTLSVSDGLGGMSTDTVTVTVENLTIPAPPANLEGFGGNNAAALRWAENEEADLVGYNIYRGQLQVGPTVR